MHLPPAGNREYALEVQLIEDQSEAGSVFFDLFDANFTDSALTYINNRPGDERIKYVTAASFVPGAVYEARLSCAGTPAPCKYKINVRVVPIDTLQSAGDVLTTMMQPEQRFFFKVRNPTSAGRHERWAHLSLNESNLLFPFSSSPSALVFPCAFGDDRIASLSLSRDKSQPAVAVAIRLDSFCGTFVSFCFFLVSLTVLSSPPSDPSRVGNHSKRA